MKRLGGWWRLWIVVTVLWFVLVVAFGIAVWPSRQPALTAEDLKTLSPSSVALIYTPNPSLKTPTSLPDDLFPPAKKGASERGPWDRWASSPVLFTAPDGTEHTLIPAVTAEQIASFKADYMRVQAFKLRAERLEWAWKLTLVWALPCLIALALGLSAHWVFRGFKRAPAHPPTGV